MRSDLKEAEAGGGGPHLQTSRIWEEADSGRGGGGHGAVGRRRPTGGREAALPVAAGRRRQTMRMGIQRGGCRDDEEANQDAAGIIRRWR